MLARLLATDPDGGNRAAMAKIYAADGKALEGKQKWADASAAYAKANGVDPKGALAQESLASHHYALGKSLDAAGKDGSPDFRRAAAPAATTARPRRAAPRRRAARSRRPSRSGCCTAPAPPRSRRC